MTKCLVFLSRMKITWAIYQHKTILKDTLGTALEKEPFPFLAKLMDNGVAGEKKLLKTQITN